jgi:hypothetical protein
LKIVDPYQRTSLEVQILGHLNDRKHPIRLDEIIALNPDRKETIVCTVLDFRDEGLVVLRPLDDGGQFVEITPQGQQIITTIYSGRTRCD